MKGGRVAAAVLLGVAAWLGVLLWRSGALLLELWRVGGTSPDLRRLAVAVLLLAAAETAVLAALRLRPAARGNVALAAATTVGMFYGGEIALAVSRPDPGAKLRDKLARLEAMRRAGLDPSPGVEPVRFVWAHEPGSPRWLSVGGRPTLPLGGISRRRTIDCREAGDWLVFDTDEHGFHNPGGLWSAPLDVAFLGDSFVHGSCVPSEANMVAAVRRVRPATLNLGTAGGGPLLMLAQLREYLPALRPRAVVWSHFSGNDLLDLRAESQHPLLARYLEPGHVQGLASRQDDVDRALGDYAATIMMPALERRSRRRVDMGALLALRELRAAAGLTLSAPYRLAASAPELALFARVLAEAKRTVEGWGGRLVFAYLPAWEEPPRQLGEAEYHRLRREAGARARAIARDLELPLVDVEAAFAAHPDRGELYACPGCHYSPQGYGVAAAAVLAALDREGR
jgi:hypothetical protein